jgi:hypothetical protein
MNKRLLIMMLALSALVSLPAPAAEAQTSRVGFSFHGDVAEAGFSSFDASGCLRTDVIIFALDGRIIGPDERDLRSVVVIDIFQTDVCAGDTLVFFFSSSEPLAADEFQVKDRLRTATLDATVEGFEFISGTSLTIDIHVTWTGEGPISRLKERFQTSNGPGNFFMEWRDFVSRHATASGTVTDGTTNFTPEPTDGAQLLSVKEGQLEIIRE